jgi:ribosomal protein S1
LAASQDIGLEINTDKTNYMVMSRDQKAGSRHNIKIDNSPFQSVEDFKYLRKTVTNENTVQEEINSKLKSGMLVIIRCRIFCLQVCYPKI